MKKRSGEAVMKDGNGKICTKIERGRKMNEEEEKEEGEGEEAAEEERKEA